MKSKEYIKAENIDFTINGKDIISNISLSLNTGISIAVIGKNGSGKTTLLNCLTGYYKISNGVIKIRNFNICDLQIKDICKYVTLCSKAPDTFYECSVKEMVLFGRTIYSDFWGNFNASDKAIAEKYIRLMELEELQDMPYSRLSQGEKQRTAIAMALAAETEFIMLDEPTSHLDPYFTKKTIDYVLNKVKINNIGVLAVLHDINLAVNFDYIFVLDSGKIKLQGNPQEILKHKNLNKIFGREVFKTLLCENNTKVNLINIIS